MAGHENRTELFDRFNRRSMIALMFVGVILGGAGLSVALSPPGAAARVNEFETPRSLI